ncbi:unnamed protein product [Prunus brigantina]
MIFQTHHRSTPNCIETVFSFMILPHEFWGCLNRVVRGYAFSGRLHVPQVLLGMRLMLTKGTLSLARNAARVDFMFPRLARNATRVDFVFLRPARM